MPELNIRIRHEAGLHARPLAKFVKVVKAHDAAVKVKNITNGKGPANGASPINLLLLSVLNGNEINIDASGNEADQVLIELKALIESNFDSE